MPRATGRVCARDARIARVTHPCSAHVTIECALAGFPESRPGQFLQLRCADDDSGGASRSVQSAVFLRRPFSIADRWDAPDGETHLLVISRAVGRGTRWLDRAQAGGVLNLSGPFGRPFHLPEDDVPILLVGGGVGIPPLLYLARRLHELDRRNVIALFGATTRSLFPVPLVAEPDADRPRRCLELPGGADFGAIVTTDDGTLGLAGVVTDAIPAWVARLSRGRKQALVVACGPEGMLRAVARQTRALGLACQLCIERTMGCGFGTCLSCVTRVRSEGDDRGWRWALTCSEGPVFDRDVLLDYAE